LWVFGEPGINYLWFESKPTQSDLDRAIELFPEAKLKLPAEKFLIGKD
jgi:hypothetical protein